jgi:hypothetical protein
LIDSMKESPPFPEVQPTNDSNVQEGK